MKLLSGLFLTAFLLALLPISVSAQTCTDTDNDGICDIDDRCPLDNPDDTDGDGICDSDDKCPLDFDNTCAPPSADCASIGTGKLRGLCNAYCEATDCDGEPKASERACNKLLANYIRASDGELPPCVGQPEPPQQPELCSETCSASDDGDCDDGGPSSDYDLCELGTDCTDCGVRCPDGLVPDVNNTWFCTFPNG